MAMDAYCPALTTGPLVVDAKYRRSVSAGNLQQMVTYCFASGASRAVLVLPEDFARDRRPYRFRAQHDPDGKTITVYVVGFRTDAATVAGWRGHAAQLAETVSKLE